MTQIKNTSNDTSEDITLEDLDTIENIYRVIIKDCKL